jgi:hypothetical protein
MMRDSNTTTNISTINASTVNVGTKLNLVGSAEAIINGKTTINGLLKINGAIDTSLGAGIVFSNSSGVLSTRNGISSQDILNYTIKNEDIRDCSITSSKLAPNLSLEGVPTCDNSNICKETQIANIGYVNRYVTNYVNQKINRPNPSNCLNCSLNIFCGNGCCNNPCEEKEELDLSIFHIKTPNYTVSFNSKTYVVENGDGITIKMPRVKKEGYSVKFYNKSGNIIYINSDSDRLMYNVTYSPYGTNCQVIENNRCVIFTYVYFDANRSWSYQYF